MAEPGDTGRAYALGSALYLDHTTEELFRAFANAGIHGVLLKGPAVGRVLYEGGSRMYSDADVLVDPRRVADARRVLAALGFSKRFPGAGLEEAGVYAEEYVRKSAMVDLHLRYPGIDAPAAEAFDLLVENSEGVVLRRHEVPMLRPHALALIVALHAAKSPGANDDIGRAIDLLGDDTWRDTFELARRLDAVTMVTVGVRRAAKGAVLLERLKIATELPARARLMEADPPPLALGLQRLADTPGLIPKLRFIARELCPSPDGLRYWSPLARRGRVGLMAAYVRRPFFLARRFPGALRAWAKARRGASAPVRRPESTAEKGGPRLR